jgi:rSAM/selenodomain-associated transferase 2
MISVVIPSLNEYDNLLRLIEEIYDKAGKPAEVEIIISDGGSLDQSSKFSERKDVTFLAINKAQRAHQMNQGAAKATGDVLYFLHADSSLPEKFDSKLLSYLKSENAVAGSFRMKFDWNHPVLRFYAFFTRFSHDIFHGGDASLFIKRSCFEKLGGFNESMDLMEDYDIISRLKELGKFGILSDYLMTSARKYRSNGVIRLQWHYLVVQFMYRTERKQEVLKKYVQKHIRT